MKVGAVKPAQAAQLLSAEGVEEDGDGLEEEGDADQHGTTAAEDHTEAILMGMGGGRRHGGQEEEKAAERKARRDGRQRIREGLARPERSELSHGESLMYDSDTASLDFTNSTLSGDPDAKLRLSYAVTERNSPHANVP